MDARPEKKLVVITGGSRGIGAATAIIAAAKNYRVALTYKDRADLANTVVRTIEQNGGIALAYRCDVARPKEVTQLFNNVDKDFGRLDALVNNAGVSGGRCSLADVTPGAIKHIVAVNLLGAFYSSQEAFKRMALSKGGSGGCIVNVSSEAGRFGGNLLSVYAASKSALNTMVIGLARELGPEGIRINAVSPGIIFTDQGNAAQSEHYALLAKSIPLGRVGKNEEIAQAILWLISDEASYVSGAVLSVSGGR